MDRIDTRQRFLYDFNRFMLEAIEAEPAPDPASFQPPAIRMAPAG